MENNWRRIQVRLSDKLQEAFDKEVERQESLFGHTSESEVAARLIYKALTANSNTRIEHVDTLNL